MNVKIKAAGVSCLVGNDYEQVFSKLRKEFGEGDDLLFTQRTPGHQYLQWELPGDGWQKLSDSDPIMAQQVRQELDQRKQVVANRFGSNREFAMRLMTVPDESYVYYKPDAAGRLIIKLTAWGYRFPERVSTGRLTGREEAKDPTEHVELTLTYDGKPLPNKEFTLNGFNRKTDENGKLDIGDLPLGYSFDLGVNGKNHPIDVAPGMGDLKIDLTEYVDIDVTVTKDGAPYVCAMVKVNYSGRVTDIATDAAGKASVQMPVALDGSLASVSVDDQLQQKAVEQPATSFTFTFVTPPAPPVVDNEEEKKPEETPEETKPVIPPLPPVVDDKKDDVTEEKKEEKEEEKAEEKPAEQPADNSGLSWLWGMLGALALLALIAGTYAYCYGMLFG